MFPVRFRVARFFNGHNVQRVNVGDAFRLGINHEDLTRRNGCKIWMRHRHTRAVAQAKHKGFRVLIQPFANQI